MRKMKKILAWLTVLTVNVSMMPMPTVAAATAADASTASNEEITTSDATKEATQAFLILRVFFVSWNEDNKGDLHQRIIRRYYF